VVDPSFGWYEPSRSAMLMARCDPSDLLDAVMAGAGNGSSPKDPEFLRAWIEAGRQKARADRGQPHPTGDGAGRITAAGIHRELGRSYRDGDLVYTASSLAIREQESFLEGSEADVLFFSNRGANGIDGVIASGLGAAKASSRPTTIVTGELGFQHDLGSLALLGEAGVPVRVVVVNDNGGRIFSRLPQKQSMPPEEFELLMSTPSDLNIEAAAGLFSNPYARVTEPAGLVEVLEERREGLIEIVLAG
jgi:2-succinyl-5-enolpyruvyl-6-hydroxy-3-cyclohexene-1-carboxylate synthase